MNFIIKNLLYFAFLVLLFSIGCKSNQGLFSSAKTAHQQYADRLEKAGLDKTSMARDWISSASNSFLQAVEIALPYRETGYFNAAKPRAEALKFNIRQGEKLHISIKTNPDTAVIFFTELWEMPAGIQPKYISEADTSGNLIYESDHDASMHLRIQPELLQNVEYTISITTGPSLAFPIRINDEPKISSFWGAGRDGGIRKHEGVDIFAKKRTPLVAAANGIVTRVNENNLGGKVIFMRPDNKSYSLYYAHLDSQIARPGQHVKSGDIIGLMGNTGNAKTTPPHLHFGIYTGNGAVDPLPYIDRNRKLPAPVTAETKYITEYLRPASKSITMYSQPDMKSSVVKKLSGSDIVLVSGATDSWYRVWVNDSTQGFISEKQLSDKPTTKMIVNASQRLLHQPETGSPALKQVGAGTQVDVIGRKGDFLYVKDQSQFGWLEDKL